MTGGSGKVRGRSLLPEAHIISEKSQKHNWRVKVVLQQELGEGGVRDGGGDSSPGLWKSRAVFHQTVTIGARGRCRLTFQSRCGHDGRRRVREDSGTLWRTFPLRGKPALRNGVVDGSEGRESGSPAIPGHHVFALRKAFPGPNLSTAGIPRTDQWRRRRAAVVRPVGVSGLVPVVRSRGAIRDPRNRELLAHRTASRSACGESGVHRAGGRGVLRRGSPEGNDSRGARLPRGGRRGGF